MKWPLIGLTLSISIYTEQDDIGLLHIFSLSEPVAVIFGFLLLDFFATFKHRLFHMVPLLWRVHVVHHSDLDCDVSTSLRSHPLDFLVDSILWVMFVTASGASPFTILLYNLISIASNPIRHGNVYIPDQIERFLRLVIVTPDYHRIHHSSIKRETNSNYSVVFPWWDWLMQTYCAEPVYGQQEMRIGLEYYRDEEELWLPKMLTQPFRKQIPNVLSIDDEKEKITAVAIKQPRF